MSLARRARDAVWKRVELVEAGLAHRIVFAVGQHLCVSEAALDAALPAAPCVYKRTMSAKRTVERVDALATFLYPASTGRQALMHDPGAHHPGRRQAGAAAARVATRTALTMMRSL